MKLIWLTDIHLNFLNKEKRLEFYKKVKDADGENVIITGDIAEAPNIVEVLKEMAECINKSIYFVLGNHDYYRGDVFSVRQQMVELTLNYNFLFWLPESKYIDLDDDTILVGQDCWADGGYGDYRNSNVRMTDSILIQDLNVGGMFNRPTKIDSHPVLQRMQELAKYDACILKQNLDMDFKEGLPKKVIILTHVPPFKESCLFERKPTGKDYLPFYASKVTGDLIKKVAKKHPSIDFMVLSGHTHHEGEFRHSSNLTSRVGKSEYYYPEIQDIITV